jgi:menaquinone-dependent protoporphyrinogen IX oxidase
MLRMKTLIVYGSPHGAASEISEEIAKILRGEGFDVKVIDAKEEKVKEISEYELVVVGSGLQQEKWACEAEGFLKQFQKDLAKKKTAIFVSSAFFSLSRIQGKTAEVDRTREKYLEQKAASYSLKPIATAIFGGVMDFNKMGFLARKTSSWAKPSFEAAGYKETRTGVYDTRDWNEIKDWARKLILKARYL